jgi:ZIP family zinc transporter
VVLTAATVIGWAVADNAPDELIGAVNGFAAGALLVMLVDSMVPDATRQAGRPTGLVTTLGFAVAAAISGIG